MVTSEVFQIDKLHKMKIDHLMKPSHCSSSTPFPELNCWGVQAFYANSP